MLLKNFGEGLEVALFKHELVEQIFHPALIWLSLARDESKDGFFFTLPGTETHGKLIIDRLRD